METNMPAQDEQNLSYEPPQPVAYDKDGRPLYAAPPQSRFVHVSRAIMPEKQPVSPEVKARHDESIRRFPYLNLSEQEYVISNVKRHWIGMSVPIILTVFLVAFVMATAINFPIIADSLGIGGAVNSAVVILIASLLSLVFLTGCYIAVSVYGNNRFFLTNESVIQEIQDSLFSKREQTISLANVEDASYTQSGILQTMLDYGSIRLSTEGEETTYRFPFVANPKKEIALLNNAVESFKNGRPVEG